MNRRMNTFCCWCRAAAAATKGNCHYNNNSDNNNNNNKTKTTATTSTIRHPIESQKAAFLQKPRLVKHPVQRFPLFSAFVPLCFPSWLLPYFLKHSFSFSFSFSLIYLCFLLFGFLKIHAILNFKILVRNFGERCRSILAVHCILERPLLLKDQSFCRESDSL